MSNGRSLPGSVYLLDLGADGTVRQWTQITDGQGGFEVGLDATAEFGSSMARIADLDGDGVDELAVAAPGQGRESAPMRRRGIGMFCTSIALAWSKHSVPSLPRAVTWTQCLNDSGLAHRAPGLERRWCRRIGCGR